MFKVLIKHLIYEKCIQILFNNIQNAFNIGDKTKLITGHEYKEVQFIREYKYKEFNYLIDIFRNVTFYEIEIDGNGHVEYVHGPSFNISFNAAESKYVYYLPKDFFDKTNKNWGGGGSAIEYKVITY